jgi:F-type H+-transporting ATPase subunit delta
MFIYINSQVYSKALFNIALSEDKLERVYNDMNLLHSLLLNSSSFKKFLFNPCITNSAKIGLVEKIFKDVLDELSLGLLKHLFKKRLYMLIVPIIGGFIDKYKTYKKVLVVNITTVFPLNEELRRKLKNWVAEVTQCNAIELIEHVDRSLIGGYIIYFNSMQLDKSLRAALNRLLSVA